MMKTDKNIAYVGTLQDLGRPFSMLFIDKENRQLYVLVRLSDGHNNRFMAVAVTADEVESYMKENIGLLNILSGKPYSIALISADSISVSDETFTDFTPTSRMRKLNMFDPELCKDDVWLEVFLNRINNNQPIEIA